MKTQNTVKVVWLGLSLLLVALCPIICRSETLTPTPVVLAPITVNDTNKTIRVDGYLVDWPVTRMILLNQVGQSFRSVGL